MLVQWQLLVPSCFISAAHKMHWDFNLDLGGTKGQDYKCYGKLWCDCFHISHITEESRGPRMRFPSLPVSLYSVNASNFHYIQWLLNNTRCGHIQSTPVDKKAWAVYGDNLDYTVSVLSQNEGQCVARHPLVSPSRWAKQDDASKGTELHTQGGILRWCQIWSSCYP